MAEKRKLGRPKGIPGRRGANYFLVVKLRRAGKGRAEIARQCGISDARVHQLLKDAVAAGHLQASAFPGAFGR